MSRADELRQHGRWEWRTEPAALMLPEPHAGEQVVRVRWRLIGTRNFRSFLLMGFDGEEPSSDYVIRAIQEHTSR